MKCAHRLRLFRDHLVGGEDDLHVEVFDQIAEGEQQPLLAAPLVLQTSSNMSVVTASISPTFSSARDAAMLELMT